MAPFQAKRLELHRWWDKTGNLDIDSQIKAGLAGGNREMPRQAGGAKCWAYSENTGSGRQP